jgi:site-specific recombinase XerD
LQEYFAARAMRERIFPVTRFAKSSLQERDFYLHAVNFHSIILEEKELTVKDEIAQFDLFLKRRFGDRSTPKHYVNDLMLFVDYTNDKPVALISPGDVDGFVAAQLNRSLQATTVNRRLASLHSFFEFLAALDPDQAAANPVVWRQHKVKEGQPLPRDIPDQQVAMLFAAIADARDKAIFGLMIGAGLRVSEVAHIRLEDLEAPAAAAEMARLRVCGKGEKERIVWVTPTWYGSVAHWLAVRPVTDHDFLFLNRRGQPLSVRGMQHRLQSHCQQARYPPVVASTTPYLLPPSGRTAHACRKHQ